jgi:hypothetical protein
MTHKIAIITSREFYSGYDGEDYNKIVTSITEWESVTDEEFKALQFAAPRMGFQILEQPLDTKAFVARTLKDYLAIANAEAKKAEEEKKKREEAALERKFKKELKDKASKIKMFKKLQEELGADAT